MSSASQPEQTTTTAAVPGAATVRESVRVQAPAAAVFAVLADPARHHEFDGSQMLRGPAGSGIITKVGDTFRMRMWLDGLGYYVMLNRVLAYETDRLIIWEPTPGCPVSSRNAELPIGASQGYWWGFELKTAGAGNTVVTEMFDCSQAHPDLRAHLDDGETWRPAMTETLRRIANAVIPAI